MRTFSIGGIHPPASKLSAGQPIQIIKPPDMVIIPLSQHIGAPAAAVVTKGDKVNVGTLIGKTAGFVSANVHSSVSGIVLKVDNVIDGFGFARPAVYIQTESDEWEPTIDRSETLIKDCTLSPTEIIQKIDAAGIVGMGGAAFPTKIKLSPPPGNKAEVLIVNAVECEPYLTADHALMLAKAEQIMAGIQLLMTALNVSRTVIGIENNKPDAIALMEKLSANEKGIEIVALKTQYPQGGEKQLIDAILHRQVKSGALPISVGAIVHNVGTVYAVYEAVQKNKPLIERVVTMTGKNIARPSNILARIGTPISVLLDAAGVIPANTGKIIAGGPMMGKTVINTDVPFTKGMSGILLMTQDDAKRGKMYDCIRCAKCVGGCPMGLEPSLLMNLAQHKLWEEIENNYVIDCIECGSCSYTCPANRPLLDYIRLGKTTVKELIKARNQ